MFDIFDRLYQVIFVLEGGQILKKEKKIYEQSTLKYKKYLIWPIKYIKHYKSTEYMKRTILSINMIGNEKQKTWQKNTIFKSKMFKILRLNRFKYLTKVLYNIYTLQHKPLQYHDQTKNLADSILNHRSRIFFNKFHNSGKL